MEKCLAFCFFREGQPANFVLKGKALLGKNEQRSLLLVAFILLLSALLQWMQPHQIKTDSFDYTLPDSLFRVLSADTQKVRVRLPRKINRKHSPQRKKTQKPKTTVVHLNTASAEELEALPSIGPKTAQAIVRYREKYGPFRSIDQLDDVKRIGPKTIERIRPFLVIDSVKTP
jgi:competence protein ComEA